ncbi:MAG: SDR family oxidoreductase [Oscillospiraceae bacterium]|nr:SDR family oxidoreductase [Oscillospiraceae bacterium]
MNCAFVTGAVINTGAAIVEKLAAEGRNVVFTGRDAAKVAAAEAGYRAKFPEVSILGYAIDSHTPEGVIDENSVLRMFEALDEKGIFIDALVLNAAHLGLNQTFLESPLSDFLAVLNTNVTWNYCLAREAAKRMIPRGGGSITFINSITAYRTVTERTAYITSKGGQLGLMRSLALDLGKYNIRVNAVLPGNIRTRRWLENPEFYASNPGCRTPLGDVAEGADIADAVWYFISAARNTTGAELVVDGGNNIQMFPN